MKTTKRFIREAIMLRYILTILLLASNCFAQDTAIMDKENTVSPDLLNQYVGTYPLTPDISLTFTLEDDQLMVQAGNYGKYPVSAMSEAKFFLQGLGDTVEFFKDDKGVVSHLIYYQGESKYAVRRTGYKKEPAPIDGTWITTANGPDGNPVEVTYVLEGFGNTIIGTASSPLGSGPFSKGKIDGNKILLVADTGQSIMELTGTLSGDEINFTRRNGDNVDQFIAKRVNIGISRDNYILDVEFYPPSVESGNVAIMFLGGSEGGIPNFSVEPFTAKGYPCIKVGYFRTEHTPDHLEMIPLEYFEKAIGMFKSQSEVKEKKIVVIGVSKGGELALLLASIYKQIEGVVAIVPSSVVFQGLGPGGSSSWSYKEGKPVPFVPWYEPFDYSKVVNNQWGELYKLSLTQTDAVEKAVIKVEQINGPILIITGKEDKMWPSSQMGDMITKRLKENKFPHWYKHYAYENAGHVFNEESPMGGTSDGNKKAGIDSEKRIFDFLLRLSES